MHTEHAQYDYSRTAAAALCDFVALFSHFGLGRKWLANSYIAVLLLQRYNGGLISFTKFSFRFTSSASDSFLPSKPHQLLDFNFPKRSYGQKTPVLRSIQPCWLVSCHFYIMMKPKTWYSATPAFLGSRKIK